MKTNESRVKSLACFVFNNFSDLSEGKSFNLAAT